MKRKNLFGLLMLSALTATSLVGCVKRTAIDKTKTQLYLYCYNGGYGSEWLKNASARFAEAVKDISFEQGKTGVQVIMTADKTNSYVGNPSAFNSDTNDVYFTEGVSYGDLYTSEKIFDLTEIINEVNPYDGKKIIDKIEDQYKDYLTRDGKIYGLPHYPGYYGIAYSIEMFDKYNAYIDENGEIMGRSGSEVKGLGPNGDTGIKDGVDLSYDDGLPATYDEFFDVCNFLKNKGVKPINWSGKYAEQHLNGLFRTLVADADGAEVSKMRSSLTGDPVVMKLDNSNRPIFNDVTGLLETETGHVTLQSRHDIYRTPGIYYAANFMERLCDNGAGLVSADARDDTITQYDAQESFINSNTDYVSKDEHNAPKEYAMLVDGPWWESEGREYFDKLVKKDKGNTRYARENRKFGWLPLPKPTEEMVGNNNCILDHLESFVIARKSTEERNEMIKKFLLFMHQDAELVNFAKDTGVKRLLKYDISDTDLQSSSAYVNSLAKYLSDCDVVYPGVNMTHYDTMYREVTTFDSLKKYFQSNIDGTQQGAGYAFFVSKNPLTAEGWFADFYETKKTL